MNERKESQEQQREMRCPYILSNYLDDRQFDGMKRILFHNPFTWYIPIIVFGVEYYRFN
jgi:hypothetical protein